MVCNNNLVKNEWDQQGQDWIHLVQTLEEKPADIVLNDAVLRQRILDIDSGRTIGVSFQDVRKTVEIILTK